MNRILSIAILLLTLLTAEEMRAQDMINETGYKCNDGGFEYISPIPCDFVAACEEECSSCQGFFHCDEIKEHEKGCYYECPLCNKKMTVIEGLTHNCEPEDPNKDQDDPYDPSDDDDDRNSPNQDRVVCALCGAVMTYMESLTHNCRRLNVNGNYNGSLWYLLQPVNGSAASPSGGGGGGGGGNSSSQNNNSSNGNLTIQNILDLLSGKPGKFYGLLKELYDAGKIVFVDDLKNARYFQESKTLKIGSQYTLDVVTHELIHYLQDKKGKLSFDNNSSNNEFQTYLLNYIYGWTYGLPAPPMGLSNDTEWWDEFQLKIVDYVEMGSTTISKEILDLLNEIDYDVRVKNFSDYYKEISKDWDLKPSSNWNSYDKNYNYSWKEFMEEIGFEFK